MKKFIMVLVMVFMFSMALGMTTFCGPEDEDPPCVVKPIVEVM